MTIISKYLFFTILPLFLLFTGVQAQSKSKSPADSLIEVAKGQMGAQKYEEAYATFIKVFGEKTVLPDEVAFYFGKTLLKLHKKEQSKEALKKYVELTGKRGEFYQEATQMLQKMECEETGMATVEEVCAVCEGSGKALNACRACKGKGKELCNSCQGTGVYKTQGNFGATYQTCSKCSGKGIIDCSVCFGKKEVKKNCQHCSATGFLKLRVPCR